MKEKMGMKGITVVCIVLLWSCCFHGGFAEKEEEEEEDVKVTVGGVTSMAEIDDNFICATIDWWPSDKCDYDQCPWELAGLFNLVIFFYFCFW